jgi:hypothetical protein
VFEIVVAVCFEHTISSNYFTKSILFYKSKPKLNKVYFFIALIVKLNDEVRILKGKSGFFIFRVSKKKPQAKA